jgi:hypothetical protein
MEVFDIGERLQNGTWTGAFGMLHSGVVDTWASYITLTEDITNDFLYSMPFVSERYVLLMKRNSPLFDINMHGLFGGFQLDVYISLAAVVLILLAIMLVNEKRHGQHVDDRVNKTFTLLLNFMPTNCEPLKWQTGVTRKILQLTCGIATLLMFTYYQSNLLQHLLVPRPPDEVTVTQVAQLLETNKSRLVVTMQNGEVENLIEHSHTSALQTLAQALIHNPLLFEKNETRIFDMIDNKNAILLEDMNTMTSRLTRITPKKCASYTITPLTDTHVWYSLVLRKDRKDMLENLNAIVAQRYIFIDKFVDTFQLSDECRQKLHPAFTNDFRYVSIQLDTVSGAFVFALCCALLSVCVFIGELICAKYYHGGTRMSEHEMLVPLNINFNVDVFVTTDECNYILDQYEELVELLSKIENHTLSN